MIGGLDGAVFPGIDFDHSLLLHVVSDLFETLFNLPIGRLVHDSRVFVDVRKVRLQDDLVDVLGFAPAESGFVEFAGASCVFAVGANDTLALADLRVTILLVQMRDP